MSRYTKLIDIVIKDKQFKDYCGNIISMHSGTPVFEESDGGVKDKCSII